MLNLIAFLRYVLRTLRLNKLVAKLVYPNGYETKFDHAVLARITKGDTVWDVGANIGYYTEKFVVATGPDGFVQGFEPIPDTFGILSKSMTSFENVSLFCYALGKSNGSLLMSNSDKAGSPTNKIIGDDSELNTSGTTVIQVRRGDELVKSQEVMNPNVIKIDVEGHEGDVIAGIAGLLDNTELHTIAMEIHFALLDERNERNTPSVIVNMLVKHSFDINWTDPSHLIAVKKL